jgi:hypothetical protein
MTPSRRRTVLLAAGVCLAVAMSYAYWLSLTPATHPDHDHGILNLDAGGRLIVETRDGKTRNLVGKPGHPLVLHFFSTGAPGASDELAGIFLQQEALRNDKDVEFVLIAHAQDFGALDAWLKEKNLVPPFPRTLVVDPSGDATMKLNSKRPNETMFFAADGKLASQARGSLTWPEGAAPHLAKARSGESIE